MTDNFCIHMCLTNNANEAVAAMLAESAGLEYTISPEPHKLLAELEEGAGAVLLEEECLAGIYQQVSDFLNSQPDWSEIPVILLRDRVATGTARTLLAKLPNVTLLERPVSKASLISHFQAALRSRKRQYRMRDLIDNLEILREGLEKEVAERTAEAEQRRRDAERINQELQHFASVVSHDLREPLLVISRYLQVLKGRYEDVLDKDGLRFIDQGIDSAGRMQSMIKSILRYSRSESAELKIEIVDTVEIVRQVVADLEIRISETSAELVCRQSLPQVCGDRMLIAQLFQNLIGNALKFAKAEEPPKILISAENSDEEWQFEVRDNGIGIDFENHTDIFRIFDRVGSTHRYPGSGIGLAVCKKIVERHGGIIWVESEPGRGSSFFFTLPNGKSTQLSAKG